jgi:hypothetical protein
MRHPLRVFLVMLGVVAIVVAGRSLLAGRWSRGRNVPPN